MTNELKKLLTIYTESALESSLISDIEQIGATGYTITNARGKGSSGIRAASWEPNSNIRIEIICDQTTVEKLSHHFQKKYYDNYAMVMSISDVEVLRPEKFSK